MSNRDAGRRFLLGEEPLQVYFATEEKAAQVFADIQYKLVEAMLLAENSKGRHTGADHYISEANDHIRSLARKFMPRIYGLDKVYGLKDLPKYVLQFDQRQQQRVLDNFYFSVALAILKMMHEDNHLYYMSGHGEWWFTSDICRRHDHAARRARLAWRDERAYHGRPSQQGRQRTHQLRMAPAVSGGYGRYATS